MGWRGRAADASRELPFSFLEDSKHAYYLVFDFEIEVTDQVREHLAMLNLCAGAAGKKRGPLT